jgi:Ca2+-binding RTX toxin-like protein
LTDTSTAAQTITVAADASVTLNLGTDTTGTESITATALLDGQVLTLTGSNNATLSFADGDIDAHAYVGALVVTGTGTMGQFTTGTVSSSISSTGATTIVASAMADGQLLTTSGAGDLTITGLQADLATTGSGALAVTTLAVATGLTVTITDTAAVVRSINADLLADGVVLTLAGTGTGATSNTISLVAGDLTSTMTGDLIVNATTGTNVITTGAGNDTITGGAGNDNMTGGLGNDTFKIAFGGEGSDTIQDFTVADDVIHFTGGSDVAGVNGQLSTYAIVSTSTLPLAAGLTVIDNTTASGSATDLTAANVAAYLAGYDTTGIISGATDKSYIVVSDGTDSAIFKVTNDAVNAIADTELTLIVTLAGITDTTTLSVANFPDFV